MAVFSGCDRIVFPPYRWVVDEQMHHQAIGHGCVHHGDLAAKAIEWSHLSLGQGQSILQP